MRRLWVALAVAAQLLVLAWIAGEREWIFRTGQVVYLRTAPIDPRDLFRGDFVRLHYEINSVQTEDVDAETASTLANRPRHQVVYTRLRPAGEGLFEAAGTTLTEPAEGLYLRGRTEDPWRAGWRGGTRRIVKYGIEQLFVEQGTGRAIEQRRGTRDKLQVPMEVEVAVGSSGKAVIRGYRWSRLGMKLEMLRRPQRRSRNAPPPPGPLSPKLRVTLENTADAPLTLVDAGEHCAFRLVAVEWAAQTYPPAPTTCDAMQESPESIALEPGQTYSVELDLSEPRWHVLEKGKTVEIGALPALAQFRIEYRAPQTSAAAAGAPGVWQGRLPSQAFTANGIID